MGTYTGMKGEGSIHSPVPVRKVTLREAFTKK